jgi:hypothetical protein
MATAVRAAKYSFCPWPIFQFYLIQGFAISKFASTNVHRHFVAEDAYREKRYEEALKRAFLGTDEDILAGEFCPALLRWLLGVVVPVNSKHVHHRPRLRQKCVGMYSCGCVGYER